MINAIFQVIGDAISGFVNTLSTGLNGIASLVYDSTNSQFTFVGILMLIGVAVGLVWLLFRMIRGLTKGVAN